MNSPKKQNQVFEHLRKSQPELSKQQVQEIIKRLPSLPIPKGGNPSTLGFNFYSIIMNSIIAISLISGILFLMNPEEKQEVLSEDISVSESLSSESTRPETLAKTDIIPAEMGSPSLEKPLVENTQPIRPASQDPKASVEQAQNSPVGEKQSRGTSIATLKPKANSISLAPVPLPNESSKPLASRKAAPISFKGRTYYVHMSPISLSESKIRELKKLIQKTLKEDKLIRTGKDEIVLSYEKEIIRLNGEQLKPSAFKKYQTLLENYGISAGPHRQLRLRDKFILLGDFDSEGHLVQGIVEGNGYIKLSHLAYDPKAQEEGLFSSKNSSLLSLSDIMCDTELVFEGDIKKFKKELLQNLLQDDLLSSEKSKNRLWFPEEGLAINKTLIPNHLQAKYTSLLAQHNIIPCKDRLVQITEAYIAVGDIRGNTFKGRMNGSIDLDELNQIELSENLK